MITAAMLAHYLLTEAGDSNTTPIFLTEADVPDERPDDYVTLDEALSDIRMEPERYTNR